MATDFIAITQPVVKRAWTNLEPKLYWAMITGSAAAFVIHAAAAMGFPIDDQFQTPLALFFTFLGGYLVPSAGVAVTTHSEDGSATTQAHTGPAVDVVTGSVPVQATAAVPGFTPAMPGRYDSLLKNIASGGATDPNATQVMTDADH